MTMGFYEDTNSKDFSSMKMWLQKFWDLKILPLFNALPNNYLSKESAENMLNAMVSAGVIQSYTMTWDAANNRYAFVITAPVEPEENTQS